MILHGGPSRAFSQIMPAFDELLSSDEIDDVIAYLRSLCRNDHWARGELNLPRALITEKAFPEDELADLNRRERQRRSRIHHGTSFTNSVSACSNQLEVDVPLQFQDQNAHLVRRRGRHDDRHSNA